MKPGRELDALVAEKVMGWQVGSSIYPWLVVDGKVTQRLAEWSPSTDIAAAWEVLTSPKFCCWVMKSDHESGLITAQVEHDGNRRIAQSETAPHAICLAALRAVGGESQ